MTKNFQLDGKELVNKRKVSYSLPLGWHSENKEGMKKDEILTKGIKEHKAVVDSGADKTNGYYDNNGN